MIHQVIVFALMVTAVGCRTIQPAASMESLPADVLSMTITIEPTGKLALVHIRNTSDVTVVLSDTLGYDGVYFNLEIRGISENVNRHSRELFTEPKLTCLRSNSEVAFPVDLTKPRRRWGGELQQDDYIYDKFADGEYEMRITYASPPGRRHDHCRVTHGVIQSSWIRFLRKEGP